jgi:hypothetical protein
MKNKINYIYHINNLTNNDQAVKDIMESMDIEDIVGNIITQDLLNQEDNFKQKLDQKRKRRSTKIQDDLTNQLGINNLQNIDFGNDKINNEINFDYIDANDANDANDVKNEDGLDDKFDSGK